MLAAPFRDLQIGVMSARGDDPVRVCQWKCIQVFGGNLPFPFQSLLDCPDNLRICRCAKDRVYLRDLIKDLLLVTLCQASGHDQSLQPALFLILRHLQNGLDTFFFCVMDKTTGIDDDHIRFLLIIHHLISFFCKKPQHHFRIYQIFVAAKRNKQ